MWLLFAAETWIPENPIQTVGVVGLLIGILGVLARFANKALAKADAAKDALVLSQANIATEAKLARESIERKREDDLRRVEDYRRDSDKQRDAFLIESAENRKIYREVSTQLQSDILKLSEHLADLTKEIGDHKETCIQVKNELQEQTSNLKKLVARGMK